jgi:hypothetical protein
VPDDPETDPQRKGWIDADGTYRGKIHVRDGSTYELTEEEREVIDGWIADDIEPPAAQ